MITGATFLRFLAIICIANSHLDALYPVPALGTGGSIGNALFFMLSGYGLFLSQNSQKSFFPWYRQRIVRIYPALLIATFLLIVVAQSAWRTLDLFSYVKLFVWPTDYWFIAALMIYYVIFFIILKSQNYRYFLFGIFILTIPYVYFYLTVVDLSSYSIEGPGYFKWIFYLQTMFFGGYLAGKKSFTGSSFVKEGLTLILLIGIYYGILILMSKFGGWWFQVITHLLMFPILFFSLRFSQSNAITSVMRAKYIGAAISLISLMTLEIYLIHGNVRAFPFLQHAFFPLNIVIFWIVTLSLSYVLYRLASAIRKMVFSG